MTISNNIILLKDGTVIPLPKTGHVKFVVQERNGVESVFLNCKEWKDGRWKVTLKSICIHLFK